MAEVNLGRAPTLPASVSTTLGALLACAPDRDGGASIVRGDEEHVRRIQRFPLPLDFHQRMAGVVRHVGVTPNFREVMATFPMADGQTPPGFRLEFVLEAEGVLRADLVRDISRDRNGQKRPTTFLYSADSADPYEVSEIAGLIANLTCNPGIIYDLFINNPEANVGNRFKTRDEVMAEIGRILGPGCDISVELNNPFEEDRQKLLEEAEKFREMLSPYRVVIKVPHTGPVNAGNVSELLEGTKKFNRRWDDGATRDFFRGHNLALFLRDHGFRINFTLMFEPYQTALALQAKPYFINSFVRHRQAQSADMKRFLDLYRLTDDPGWLTQLRSFLGAKDYLSAREQSIDLLEAKKMAERIIGYRKADGPCRYDGLDGVRQNLHLLRQVNLPDTRLIICSMEGDFNYPDIADLLVEDQFRDMADRLVITAVPAYLATFTSSNQVISYQRRFMNAARGAQ